MRFPLLAFCVLVLFGPLCPRLAAASAQAAPRVAILANRDDPDSVSLAHYYARRRGLPETSILALPMPLTEQITWEQFVTAIWNPLLREALKREWLLASPTGALDPIGRTHILSSGHRLDALVICRGVPLRIAHDSARYDPKTNPLTANTSLQTNEASVDSELAVLPAEGPPVAALLPNPLFNQDKPMSFDLEKIIPVGRLDGPTLDDAKGLVDHALIAERDGLAGRAYLDLGGPHAQGNEWIEACLPQLKALGFETDVDRVAGTPSDSGTFRASARFDAPVLYFGWYAAAMNGPFAEPGFRFPAGAIAVHIHSFSAKTLRSPTEGWTGPLVAKGVTATVGNVGEPYLQFTHQPHLLLRALARGETLGRAALYSLNALSWKGILVGDPLYRPFAVSSEDQWARRAELPPATENYARLRRMHLLDAAGKREEAIALGVAGLAQHPSLALALTLAGLQKDAGDQAAARRSLGVFSVLRKIPPSDRPLALAAIRAFQAAGDSTAGFKLAKRLLDDAALPRDFRLAALLAGAELARAAGETSQASAWAAEHALLTASEASAAKS